MFGWLKPGAQKAPVGNALEESKHWFLVCPNCGHKRSYFALGGIRYKAAGTGKSRKAHCSGGDSVQRLFTQWCEEPDPADAGKPHGWFVSG